MLDIVSTEHSVQTNDPKDRKMRTPETNYQMYINNAIANVSNTWKNAKLYGSIVGQCTIPVPHIFCVTLSILHLKIGLLTDIHNFIVE